MPKHLHAPISSTNQECDQRFVHREAAELGESGWAQKHSPVRVPVHVPRTQKVDNSICA